MKKHPLYPVEYYPTFGKLVEGIERKFGTSPAVTIYTRGSESYTKTYKDLAEDIRALALAMKKQGCAGKHIAIAGENSYEWLVTFFAGEILGSPVILVDVDQDLQTLEKMILDTDTEILFYSPSIEEILNAHPSFRQLSKVCLETGEGARENSFFPLLERGRELLSSGEFLQPEEAEKEDLAVIAFTSGTTDSAKPVMLSRKGLLRNAGDANSMVNLQKRVFTSLPFYHTYGLSCSLLAVLMAGAHICVNGNLRTTMRDLQAFLPETIMTVPLLTEVIFKQLLAAAKREGLEGEVEREPRRTFFAKEKEPVVSPALQKIKEKMFGNLSQMISGGAHLPWEIAHKMEKFGVLVLQGYGITECSPLISVNRAEENRPESVGLVLPGISLRFEDGEIWVRGENVMLGYYKREEETAKVLQNGWFKTGDLGHMDKKGFLYIQGRKKNLIVLKNGKKISPEEIEARVAGLPMIGEVMAYGAAAGSFADDVKIAIAVYPDPQQTEEMSSYEILDALQKEIDRLNDGYPSYKQIQMIHLREKGFSKTATSKIKRETF